MNESGSELLYLIIDITFFDFRLIRELQTKEWQYNAHFYINIYLFLTVISMRFVTPNYSVKGRIEINF
jgi:hypothetical protein